MVGDDCSDGGELVVAQAKPICSGTHSPEDVLGEEDGVPAGLGVTQGRLGLNSASEEGGVPVVGEEGEEAVGDAEGLGGVEVGAAADRGVLNIVFRRHIRVKMGVVEKSGCAWSDIFKNQNKLSIFIRFILKENGFSTKKWGQSAKITDFRDFAC